MRWGQLLSNGGFENGSDPSPWTTSPAGVVTNAGSVAARTGSWQGPAGRRGHGHHRDPGRRTWTIPANCKATLDDDYLRVTTSQSTHPFDYFKVQAISATTTELQSFDDRDAGGSYVQRTVDLTAYAGETISLRFLSDEDSSLQTRLLRSTTSRSTRRSRPHRVGRRHRRARELLPAGGGHHVGRLDGRDGRCHAAESQWRDRRELDQAPGVERRRRAHRGRPGPQVGDQPRGALLRLRGARQRRLHRRGGHLRRPPTWPTTWPVWSAG